MEKSDKKQSNFANELKNFDKKPFLNNLGLLFSARENVFKCRLSPIKNLVRIPTGEPATESEVAAEPTKATQKN